MSIGNPQDRRGSLLCTRPFAPELLAHGKVMEVTFYRGLIRQEMEATVHASWACTPFGILCLQDGKDEGLQLIEAESIALSEPVANVDLSGADPEGVEVIVSAILKGGYLEEIGVKDRGEAVLFIMLNEVLHDLQRLRDEEDMERAGEGY